MPYLSQRALEGLKAYKYKPGGYTFLDVIHEPFWKWLTNCLPLWLAPNLITLTGLIGMMIAWVISVIYDPNFGAEAPRWTYVVYFIAQVVYVNLDCIDGKQARRTNSSSPLGQLFDHGCDAAVMFIAATMVMTSLMQTCDPAVPWMLLVVCYPWLLGHWEEYHTGIMLYSNGYVGVMEANYAMAAVHLISAIFGASVWNTALPFAIPVLPGLAIKNVRNVFFVIALVGGFFDGAGRVYRVLVFKTDTMDVKERGNKDLGHGGAFLHVLYLTALSVLGSLWLTRESESFTAGEARVILLTYGTIYALVATELIVAHMCKEPFHASRWGMALLAAGAANSLLHVVPHAPLAWGLCALTMLGYLHYVLSVVNQICNFLGIHCLRIKHAKSGPQS